MGNSRELQRERRGADADRPGAARGPEAAGRAEAGRDDGRHDEPRAFGCGHHAGEGAGPGVPVAADDGGGSLRYNRRTGGRRKDQLVLSLAPSPPHAAGAGDRGGRPGWAAARGDDAAGVDGWCAD